MNKRIRKMVSIALLLGLNIVFSRLISLSAWNFKISLTFVTTFLAAYLYGPFASIFVAGCGDLIGALLFPTGAFNPAFTLSAMLSGAIYGFFLYRKDTILSVILAVSVNQLVVSLLINTFLISYFYHASFLILFQTRAIQSAVMLVIEAVVIRSFSRFLPFLKERAR